MYISTKVLVPKRAGRRFLQGVGALISTAVALAALYSDIPQRTAMRYRHALLLGAPHYTGKWGSAHPAEGRTLWGEMQHHNLPGDLRYWSVLIRNHPDNWQALSDGYEKGDDIRVPEPDVYGR